MLTKSGFGLIEVLVALGLFVTIGTTGITLVLHSFTANRLGNEQTQATNFATSGQESLIAQAQSNFSSIVNSTTTAIWDKFTRTTIISDAYRDALGHLSDSGTLDPDVKKITTVVDWSVGGSRNNSVILNHYLTNYAKMISNHGDGFIAWGNNATLAKWSIFNASGNTFGTISNLLTPEIAHNLRLITNSSKNEALLAYTSSTGTLHLFCYNGNSWSEDWNTTVGGLGNTRRFDLAYESESGDAIIIYSTDTSNTNELAMRTKASSSSCGNTSWSSITPLDPLRTSGIIHWVKLANNLASSSDILALAWADSNSDLSSMIWDGTTWGNEPNSTTETNLENISTSQDSESFDLAYESLSNNLMLVWGVNVGNNNNGVRYRRCLGGTASCSWDTIVVPPTWTDEATNLDLASNPFSNEIIFASIGHNQSDLQLGYWSGSTWTNHANYDTSCTRPTAYTRSVATTWLINGSTTRSLISYSDSGSTRIDWIVGDGATFVTQSDFTTNPTIGSGKNYIELITNPSNASQALLINADTTNDLTIQQLNMSTVPVFSWSNSTSSELELNLPTNTSNPFAFAYWETP